MEAGPPMSVEIVQRLLDPEFRHEAPTVDRDTLLRLASDRQVHASEQGRPGVPRLRVCWCR